MSTQPPGQPPYPPPYGPPPGQPAYAMGPAPQAYATTQLAGFWRRLVAYLIDGIIVGVVSSVITSLINAGIHASFSDTTGYSTRSGLISLIIGLVYFGWLWGTRGQTLGYMALGMRVIRTDGSDISIGRAAVRYIALWVSAALCAIPLIISAFMVGLGQRKQAIHDLVADTVVVRT